MPEPTTTAVNLAAGALAVQTITVAGVHLGLRPDLLVGGFSGAVVAIVLLNLGTLIICIAALILPSMLVTRIAPARAIRFS